MAKKKNPEREETLFEQMDRESREFDKKHPILDTRYYVDEYRSERVSHNGWDTPVPSTFLRRYGPFAKEQFDKFMEENEPDVPENHFVPRHENLRHYSYEKWGR